MPIRLIMSKVDWHSDSISAAIRIDKSYKNTQNVRRFLKATCGDDFKFDRGFMQWIKENPGKTMGEAAAEWMRRKGASGSPG
jgi:hypothetical protein